MSYSQSSSDASFSASGISELARRRGNVPAPLLPAPTHLMPGGEHPLHSPGPGSHPATPSHPMTPNHPVSGMGPPLTPVHHGGHVVRQPPTPGLPYTPSLIAHPMTPHTPSQPCTPVATHNTPQHFTVRKILGNTSLFPLKKL